MSRNKIMMKDSHFTVLILSRRVLVVAHWIFVNGTRWRVPLMSNLARELDP
jgi:hypothetical protein